MHCVVVSSLVYSVEFALLLFIPQIPPLWEVTLCKVAIYTTTNLILILLLLLLLHHMLLLLLWTYLNQGICDLLSLSLSLALISIVLEMSCQVHVDASDM